MQPRMRISWIAGLSVIGLAVSLAVAGSSPTCEAVKPPDSAERSNIPNEFARHEGRANTFVSSTQENAVVALRADGGCVVAWDSRRQEQGTYGVYLQRYSASGRPIGGEVHVNVYTKNMQTRPALAIDGLGGTWVAWESFRQDGSMGAIIARRFSEDFSHSTDEILVNQSTAGEQSDVVVAGDPDGGAMFVWTTLGQNGAGRRVVARRFNRTGKPASDEFRISQGKQGGESLPSVAIDGRNRFIVVWARTNLEGRPDGIRGRILDAQGKAITPDLTINQKDGRTHIEPSVAVCTDGQFSVAWLTAAGEDYVVSARRFDAKGEPVSNTIRVSNSDERMVSGAAVAMANDGRLVVSWNAECGESKSDLYARFFDARGRPTSDRMRVNRHTKGHQSLTAASGKQRVAWGADGRLVFAWSGDSGLRDKSAANLTLLVPSGVDCRLASRVETRFGRSRRPQTEAQTAQPHVPPTFDPSTISDDPFGGDPNPFPGGVDFGFIGITSTGWTPPDPHLAAGPDHVIVITNGAIAFFQKDGTKTFQDEIENSFGFWGELGADNFVFDPEVLYDSQSGRFMAMANERSDNSRSYFLLAVSDDSDPNGSWHKYRLDVTGLAGNDIDSPNMAVDDEAVYLTADFFGPNKYLIFMVNKADVLVGDAPSTRSLLITGSQSYGIPVTYDVDAPAQYMIQSTEFSNNNTVIFHAITDPLGNPQRVTTTVGVPNYRFPERPPQMGTSARPILFEPRFWSCVYRNGSLWAVHHQNDSRVRARWYEFRMNDWPDGGTPELVQWGEIDPGSPVRTYFPSIWVDEVGNAVITCARSSPQEFISMSRAVRGAGDPLGEFRPIEFVKQSEVPYNQTRWGDYSGAASDPTQIGRFWIHHEYAVTSTRWNTWIAEVVLSSGLPTNLTVVRGRIVEGELSDLFRSDDSRLVVQAGITIQPDEPAVWLILDGSSPVASPSELKFTLETRVDTPAVSQKVELFNYDTDEFEEVDVRTAPFNEDSAVEITVAGDPARFVDDKTLDIRAQLTWKAPPLVLLFPWSVGIDQSVWTITE